MKSKFLLFLSLVLFFPCFCWSEVQVPVLRMKMGKYLTTITAGDIIDNQPLDALITLQPTMLLDFPNLRSRVGAHFMADVSSQYGLLPIAGIGISGYFYPFGISSAYEMTHDNIIQQKYRFGPFVYLGLTPVRFSVNEKDPENPERNKSFSAFLYDVMIGAGIDYPLKPNTLISVELDIRTASATASETSGETLKYTSIGINFSFLTIYY